MDVFFAHPPIFVLDQASYPAQAPRITQKEFDDCTRLFTDIAILIILSLALVLSLGTVLLIDEVKVAFSRLFNDDKKAELGPRSHLPPHPTERPDYWQPLATPLPTDEALDCTRELEPRPLTQDLLDRPAQEVLLPHLRAIFEKPQDENESLARVDGVKFFQRRGAFRVFTLTSHPNVIFKMFTNPGRNFSILNEITTLDKARRICSELGLSCLSIPHSNRQTILYKGRYHEVLIQNKLLLPTPGKQVHAMSCDSPSLNAPIKDLTTLMCESRFIHFSPKRQSPLIGSRAIGLVKINGEDVLPLTEELNALHANVGASQKHIVAAVAESYGYTKSERGFISQGFDIRSPHRRTACPQIHNQQTRCKKHLL